MTLVEGRELTTRRMVEMMRRISVLFIMCSLAISSMAQTQQGYVKTLGRQNKKGVALGGVTVRVKGAHNAMQSKNDGTFSMQIKGESYALQQVQKTGYELNDAGIIGRKYAYSSNVPLTVVMVSTAQLQADKQRIENNAFQTAEKNYKAKMAQLEKQKANNTITIEQYRQQIQDLQDKFEKYQSLIDGLADHYAHVDYDDLNEKEREINLCIEKGELERADQLLQQLGVKQRIADIERRFAAGQRLMDEAKADMAAVMKQQEKDAEHLYQLYTIALAKFDNNKARSYIETRAELDTTNLRYQLDAGNFNFETLSDYNHAQVYYQRIFRVVGKDTYELAQAYSSMGGIYGMLGRNKESKEYVQKAFNIIEGLYGKNHINYAECCVDMGVMYTSQYEFKDGLKWLELGLSILKENLGEEHEYVALCYAHIGNNYLMQSKFDKAEECYKKALEIRKKVLPANSPIIGRNYNHLASLYVHRKYYFLAIDYCEKSLNIMKQCYGDLHHTIALLYATLGQAYLGDGKNDKAISCFQKSLTDYKTIFGELHSDIATCYMNIGQAYFNIKDYKTALAYFEKCYDIQLKTIGSEHPNVAKSWEWMGAVECMREEYAIALDCYKNALNIYEKVYGSDNAVTKNARKMIRQIKFAKGYKSFFDYLDKH